MGVAIIERTTQGLNARKMRVKWALRDGSEDQEVPVTWALVAGRASYPWTTIFAYLVV
jgi:hypothetical protein